MNKLNALIARVPEWKGLTPLKVEPIGGLTNTNYRISMPEGTWILRISGENTALLGIDREAEWETLNAAARAGIAPTPLCRLLPEGHLITPALAGRHLTLAEYSEPTNLARVVETVKQMHNLPPVRAEYSPFRWIEARIKDVTAREVPLPEDFATLMKRLYAIETAQSPHKIYGFCHNDLFSVNFMDDGAIRILDWEFAGMGDIYLDLATLVYAYDSEGPLPTELQEYILLCYFGKHCSAEYLERMTRMRFVIMFRDALWSRIQYSLHRNDPIPNPDFDYWEFGEETFAALRAFPDQA